MQLCTTFVLVLTHITFSQMQIQMLLYTKFQVSSSLISKNIVLSNIGSWVGGWLYTNNNATLSLYLARLSAMAEIQDRASVAKIKECSVVQSNETTSSSSQCLSLHYSFFHRIIVSVFASQCLSLYNSILHCITVSAILS